MLKIVLISAVTAVSAQKIVTLPATGYSAAFVLRNPATGFCLDDSMTDYGTPNWKSMQLWKCAIGGDINQNQVFQYHKETGWIRGVFKELCMRSNSDYNPGNGEYNQDIVLQKCYKDDKPQSWDYNPTLKFFKLRSTNGLPPAQRLCLHTRNGLHGKPYSTRPCLIPGTNTVDPKVVHDLVEVTLPSKPYFVLSHFASYCLDDAGYSATNPTICESFFFKLMI